MTIEDRLAALEEKTQDIRRYTHRCTVTGKDIPCIEIIGRVGIFTNFWMKKDIGQGAALSIGTNNDRFALYAEIDEASCPDHPSVAGYFSVVPRQLNGQ